MNATTPLGQLNLVQSGTCVVLTQMLGGSCAPQLEGFGRVWYTCCSWGPSLEPIKPLSHREASIHLSQAAHGTFHTNLDLSNSTSNCDCCSKHDTLISQDDTECRQDISQLCNLTHVIALMRACNGRRRRETSKQRERYACK